MSSVVDICNLALSHIGEEANVTSIDPPEGSTYAQYCATYYPIARDTLLQDNSSTWNFATTRVVLAELNMPYTQYKYAYALPSDYFRVIALIPNNSASDYNYVFPTNQTVHNLDTELPYSAMGSNYAPQPYTIETDYQTGTKVLYTNQKIAMLRYTRSIEDSSMFPPLVVLTISYLLASMLAGPIIKGKDGIAVSLDCLQKAEMFKNKAIASDANDSNEKVDHIVPWLAVRNTYGGWVR